MKKFIAFPLIFICCFFHASADHITGGEVYYTLIGISNGKYNYDVTLKLFMRCNSNRQFNNPAIISVFEKGNSLRIIDIPVNLARSEKIRLTNPSRCITDPPTVCYDVGYYEFVLSVPPSATGYIISGQFNFRVSGIKNISPGYGSIGATYTAEIPGTGSSSSAPENNSARFEGSDLVIICADNSFSYSFAATDPDRDQLRYSFCPAYAGGSGGGPNNSSPSLPPPYKSLPYGSSFGTGSPLGNRVSIDPSSGLISGVAPAEPGVYVVTVCVEEIRHGAVVATQRKDIQVAIAPCTIAEAKLQPEYMLCRETKTLEITNLSTSPLISSQHWEILDREGTTLYKASTTTVTYAFSDTGLYLIKLVINRGQECSDSTTSVARVYPGFTPGFAINGTCFNKPTKVTDLSTSVLGKVTSWEWDFGENSPGANSNTRNAAFTYKRTGAKIIQLTAGNSFGCRDTATTFLKIVDKPSLNLAFRDTLICEQDELILKASAAGNFSWSPSENMVNPNTTEPMVKPIKNTTYFVDLNDDGCLNRDSVIVRVTNQVNLAVMPDTIICQGDKIQLNIASDGFKYRWSSNSQIELATVKNPFVTASATTSYTVTASIGGCTNTQSIKVSTVPYPIVDAGLDTIICFNTSAILKAQTDGIAVKWSPSSSLQRSGSLNPLAKPALSTAYICYATDTKGCPKPGTDTVYVKVLPDIQAFAGRDTTIITGQPLQLAASGGTRYVWSPSTGLSSALISNPVANYLEPAHAIRYRLLVYNEAGCVDSAFMNVRIFNTIPSVFVPNAFSPNGDGLNDLLRPIAAGLKNINFFKVYNRWGQLLFSSTETGSGWDGRVGGRLQEPGSFVWVVKAIDYTGTMYIKKGTVTLVR